MENRKQMKLPLLGMVLIFLLIGCSNVMFQPESVFSRSTAFSPIDPKQPPVELSYYYIVYEMPADQAAVEEAINAYIQPKINAIVKLKPIIESSYKDKINTMLASNEEFDILWTSNWGSGDYDNKVAKGGLLPLDELLNATPLLGEEIPAAFWEDAKVDGITYAVPNVQIAAKAEGFTIQKRFIDKYGIDIKQIKQQVDIEPILKIIHDNELEIIPIASTSNMFDFGRQYGYSAQGYKIGDPDYKILDILDKPEYRTFLEMVRRWYLSGYIYKDSATMDDNMIVSLLRTGKVAVEWNTTMKPGGEIEDRKRFGGNEVVYVRLSEPEFTGVRTTMTAISRTSKHPEKALQLIEWLETDPVLFNLITFGIENKHYTMIGNNTIRINQEGGYKEDQGWVFGNVLNGYLKEGQATDTWEVTKKMNETAKRPEVYGFNFNSERYISGEVNLFLAAQRFAKALQSGAVDPAQVFPEYYEVAQKSGVKKQTEEMQRELDQWLKVHGKK
ncbi:MAG: ABC transporter substrate-binding protein [Gorillibacterium sp.]|nr:ABC transporter substrate-binding protein [Gorillibacterium sp.]